MTAPKPSSWQRFLNIISGVTAPAIYAMAVTATLGLWFALVKHGQIKDLPIMLKFVSMQFTPFFVLGYHVARKVVPDRTLQRTTNLFLPAIEGLLAVGILTVMMSFGYELDDPFQNVFFYVIELVLSVIAARFAVRTVFRH